MLDQNTLKELWHPSNYESENIDEETTFYILDFTRNLFATIPIINNRLFKYV